MSFICSEEFSNFFDWPIAGLIIYFLVIQLPVSIYIYKVTPKNIWMKHREYHSTRGDIRQTYHDNFWWKSLLVTDLEMAYLAHVFNFRTGNFDWWDLSQLPNSVRNAIWLSLPVYIGGILFFFPALLIGIGCKFLSLI